MYLWQCWWFIHVTLEVHSFTINDVRLVGGSAPNNGIVEVLTDNGWLPMCYAIANFVDYLQDPYDKFSLLSWDSHTESKVLCRQLGYDATLSPSMIAHISCMHWMKEDTHKSTCWKIINVMAEICLVQMQQLVQYHQQTQVILMLNHWKSTWDALEMSLNCQIALKTRFHLLQTIRHISVRNWWLLPAIECVSGTPESPPTL